MRQAALTVAIVAAFLAIATFLGNESVKEAIQGQTKVSDAHAEKATFVTQKEIFDSDRLLLTVFSGGADAGQVAAASAGLKSLEGLMEEIHTERERIDTVVEEHTSEVEHANDQHLLYELAAVLLQISIVLASVAIIARRRFLLFGSHGLATVGVVVLAIGFLK